MKLARFLGWLTLAASLAPTACKKTEPPTRTPTGTCKQGACVPYSRWVADYVAIMGGG